MVGQYGANGKCPFFHGPVAFERLLTGFCLVTTKSGPPPSPVLFAFPCSIMESLAMSSGPLSGQLMICLGLCSTTPVQRRRWGNDTWVVSCAPPMDRCPSSRSCQRYGNAFNLPAFNRGSSTASTMTIRRRDTNQRGLLRWTFTERKC